MGDNVERRTRKQLEIRRKVEAICNPKQTNGIDILKSYVVITIGAMIMAMGISLFLLPN